MSVNYDPNYFHSSENFCSLCLNKNNLKSVDQDTNLNGIFKALTLLTTQTDLEETKSKNICEECHQRLERFSNFTHFIKNEWSSKKILNDIHCKVCLVPETLDVFPNNLLDIFQTILNCEIKLCNRPEYICNRCLIRLEEISNFINVAKYSGELLKQNIVIKQELLEDNTLKHVEILSDFKNEKELIRIKEELLQDDEDDEFIETLSKIKSESTVYCSKFENNNNLMFKSEGIPDEIQDFKDDVNVQQWEDHTESIKVEIEDEGLQYDSKEIIPIDCNVCNRSFNTTRGLLNHLKQRFRCRHQTSFIAQYWKYIAKPFKCQVCSKYFSTARQKAGHIKAHFEKSCVPCQLCGKYFVERKGYMNHYRYHSTKRPTVTCKLCPKKFPTKIIYLKHLSRHKKKSDRKRFTCKICGISHSKKSWLKRHAKQVKITCPYCSKIYCRKSQLASHLRSHTGERPFQCAVCSLSFSQKGNLIKHSRIHTGYRPHMCKICRKSFSRSDYLTKHYLCVHQTVQQSNRKTNTYTTSVSKKLEHSYDKSFRCNVCNNSYISKSSLSSHMRVHNKEKSFQCTVCDKSFSYKGLLTGHMKIHLNYRPFACTFCPKSFIKRNDLTRHTFTHTREKNFKCEICLETFARKDVLRLHLRNHTGQRPYECKNCCKTFAQKSNLTHHLKKCNMSVYF